MARALLEAVRACDSGAVRRLVKEGADVNGMWRGYRPLHCLIQEDAHGESAPPTRAREKMLAWLLEHGADPELPAAWPPARAVIVAAFAGRPEYVKPLLRKGDAFAAAALGDARAVRAMLRRRPGFARERDTGGLTALQCAAGSRMPGATTDVARMLLDAGAEVQANTKSWSHEIDATYLSASSKNEDLFALLLESGADATEALTSALWNGTEAQAEIALQRGAAADRAVADGQPLLNNLIRWGQFRKALWLLARCASPNIADARGWTALHQAASRGNEKMVRALLEAGADRTARDKDGCVPRDRTAREPILKLLAR